MFYLAKFNQKTTKMSEKITDFIEQIRQSITNDSFVKLNLGDYKGEIENLKKLLIKRVVIKREQKLSFVYKYATNDITKNYNLKESFVELQNLISEQGFRFGQLFTTEFDLKIQHGKKGFFLKEEKASTKEKPSLLHDKAKNRKIQSEGKEYLHQLKISDSNGKVYKNAQDKFRQINHYIEILSSLLQDLPNRPITSIADMGSGKGYLTFALYDYLTNELGKTTQITGVEFRKDLVDLCNRIAVKSNFEKLNFQQGTIQDFEPETELNVLVALHACDTATDDAIAKGILGKADLIVVAPCCHKQIRREMEANKAQKN